MSSITVQADGFVNSIPVDPATPGPFTGIGRAAVMRSMFSLAAEKGLAVNMAGQHWPVTPASAATRRMASNKMSRGMSASKLPEVRF